MARLPRLVVPNQLHLILQKGNDDKVIFADEDDYHVFLDRLKEASRQFQVAIHAYILMPDHLHLLATPKDETGLSKMMQWMGRHYVPYFNRKYLRTGTLWQGRYRATVLEAGTYFLRCCLYLESNPVRSKLVGDAIDFPWSSFQHHIGLKNDPIITDHPLYWALGNTPFQREAAYKEMMQHGFSATELAEITAATMMSWPLGSEQFKLELAKLTSRRVTPLKRGRPVKSSAQ
ncbi:transposase [Undibacterium parvum]|uniref:Transposase n=1 Tax=Undibacterium parvum TaxID=401471 RepID=A0A3S9HKR9_9BURK|nr:transposase [Undibacterium parvum]AZP12678.1 transposase [Undibacterium parvum]